MLFAFVFFVLDMNFTVATKKKNIIKRNISQFRPRKRFTFYYCYFFCTHSKNMRLRGEYIKSKIIFHSNHHLNRVLFSDIFPFSAASSLIKFGSKKILIFPFVNDPYSKSEISFIHNTRYTDRIHSSTFRYNSFVTFHVSEFQRIINNKRSVNYLHHSKLYQIRLSC